MKREEPVQIDHVYTWVNAADPEMKALRERYAPEIKTDRAYRVGSARFADNGELYLSIKLAKHFLPFVRNTYIVGAGKRPEWLDEFDESVMYINEQDLIPASVWPVFQSDVAESYIYKIPGLSEHYVYSNDDYFFARVQRPEYFFPAEGRTRVGLAPWPVAVGPTPVYRTMEENGVRALSNRGRTHPYTAPPSSLLNRAGLRTMKKHLGRRLSLAKRGLPMVNAISHVSQPFLKSHWQDFRDSFEEELQLLEGSRFRHERSIPVNFLYHHYLQNREVTTFYLALQDRLLLRTYDDDSRQRLRHEILGGNGLVDRFCLNDAPVPEEDGWHEYVSSLINDLMEEKRPELKT